MARASLFARVCTALALVTGGAAQAHAQEPLVFATIVDVRPSAMMSQRVLKYAYRQLGVEVRFDELPNPRTRALVEAHEIDGLDYRIANNPVDGFQKISIPVTYEDLVVYTAGKRFKPAGYESLRDYSIGYLVGATLLDRRLQGMKVDTAPNLESLFRKLSLGRTDVAIDSRSSYCKAGQWGLNNIVMLEPSLEKLLGYHWISARHADLIPRLETVLKKMEKDGTIKRLQEQAWKDYDEQCVVK
jgi:polar amino acid transport system substrate-binding protein